MLIRALIVTVLSFSSFKELRHGHLHMFVYNLLQHPIFIFLSVYSLTSLFILPIINLFLGFCLLRFFSQCSFLNSNFYQSPFWSKSHNYSLFGPLISTGLGRFITFKDYVWIPNSSRNFVSTFYESHYLDQVSFLWQWVYKHQSLNLNLTFRSTWNRQAIKTETDLQSCILSIRRHLLLQTSREMKPPHRGGHLSPSRHKGRVPIH